MDANDFCYWLQGFFEMSEAKTLDEKQVEMLKKHLALVMLNVTGECDSLNLKKPLPRPGISGFSSERKIY